MSFDISANVGQEDKPLTRADIERFLHEVGSSDKLTLEYQNLKGIDLHQLDLHGANLNGANLNGANLTGANLNGANLSSANLTGANLSNAHLNGANLNGTHLNGAHLDGTHLDGADLTGADLNGANLSFAYLHEAHLSFTNLNGANLSQADLSQADLTGAYLNGANLRLAYLHGASLTGVNLNGANLTGANLSLADLDEANLSGAYLSGADLSLADLNEADLNEADLSGTDLSGADLSGANLNEANLTRANLTRAKLNEVIGLERWSERLSPLFSRLRNGAWLDHLSLYLHGSRFPNTALDESKIPEIEHASTFRIRIMEEPLTPHNLTSIISTITNLSTKCWLIANRRFSDLIEYTQTNDVRFVEEAQLIITKMSHNSPLDAKFKIELSASNVAEAITTAIDGVTQAKRRLEKAELENKAKAQEIEHAKQKADQESKAALLEQERQELAIEKERLEILEKRLDVQKKGIEYAFEIAVKTVTVLHPNTDEQTKAMLVQTLLPTILQLQNGKGLELVLPAPQNSEEKKEGLENS